jgi:hypothetical protein
MPAKPIGIPSFWMHNDVILWDADSCRDYFPSEGKLPAHALPAISLGFADEQNESNESHLFPWVFPVFSHNFHKRDRRGTRLA